VRGGVDDASRSRNRHERLVVDEQQLLLDADREGRGLAEGVLDA
jgi:hypothetical protein